MDFDSRQFRNAMGRFPTGVVVISTCIDGEPHAMTANAFMSGSLEPAMIVISVDHNALTHQKITNCDYFGISILTEEQMATSNHFAGRKSENFSPTFEFIVNQPVVEGAAVQLVARLEHSYPCGDHTLFVGRVEALKDDISMKKPLLFHSGNYVKLGDRH